MRCIYEGLGRRSLLLKTSMLESEWDIREEEEGGRLGQERKMGACRGGGTRGPQAAQSSSRQL